MISVWSGSLQGVSAWNFDVAALKEQAAKEGGMDATLAPIIEGTVSDAAALPPSTAGESGARM